MIERIGGIDKVSRNLDRLIKQTTDVQPQVLTQIGTHLESEASQLAPLDKGDLRGSSTTELMDRSRVRVSFTERYALVMHEDLEYKPQEPGTGPKYLTGPLKRNEQQYMRRIIDANRVR